MTTWTILILTKVPRKGLLTGQGTQGKETIAQLEGKEGELAVTAAGCTSRR